MAPRAAGFFAATVSLVLTLASIAHAEQYGAEHADKGAIEVVLNQAKVLKMSRPASTVVIGNPEVADATVHDSTTIVLTGQGFGRTNLVVLDGAGMPILDEQIAVRRDNDSTLRVYRRSVIETLSCEPFCEAAYLTEAEIQSTRERARVNLLFGQQ